MRRSSPYTGAAGIDSAHRPLTAADLLPGGPLRRIGAVVRTFETIDSTSAWLLEHFAELPDGAVAVAEFQTHGRGRVGRTWLAPRGSSVLLSVLLFEAGDSPVFSSASMIAAVAAARAIDASTDCRPAIRWPNDLALAGRKVAGVLAESAPVRGASRPGGAPSRALVLGIGINCLQHAGHFPGELAEKATSLELASTRPVDRRCVARAVIRELDRIASTDESRQASAAEIRREWRARCADLGARVTLEHDGARYAGTVVEIDDDAALIVQLDRGGRRRFGAAQTTRVW
jgi:BirA family biotin operon repressor/biotin-[acetyl-CoA-carboxylase] ligase